MSPEIRSIFIMFGAVAVSLIFIIVTFGGSHPLERFILLFLKEIPDEEPEKQSESSVEMATLIRKSDDRLRIIESSGNVRIADEYYELTFVTRKGKTLKIECSLNAYEKIPFDKQGSLTYRKNKLVKFKYFEDIIYN
ncbi:MAG: hypothetical protein NC205_01290 [Prevotella sp.]|nr:hypothetical protein [Alistipes senegalensis]MCM1357199.1 hypothetical protein [Prevotella sp.]MCM1473987.1 hypothetical protein [Muribaculaceae bacterium]